LILNISFSACASDSRTPANASQGRCQAHAPVRFFENLPNLKNCLAVRSVGAFRHTARQFPKATFNPNLRPLAIKQITGMRPQSKIQMSRK
jgi:hypothetical protein